MQQVPHTQVQQPVPIPNVTIHFPNTLRSKVGNRSSLTITGRTVRELIDALDTFFPGIRFNLCHETGELRPYVNIFLDRENIRYLQNLDTPVRNGAVIYILPSVAGG